MKDESVADDVPLKLGQHLKDQPHFHTKTLSESATLHRHAARMCYHSLSHSGSDYNAIVVHKNFVKTCTKCR